MEIKNLFDASVKKEMINRINTLTPASQRKWGKMEVAQMLSHLQKPINFCYGNHEIKGSFILSLLGPMFKSVLYNSKPYKQGLPTDTTYVVSNAREFEKEKQELLLLLDRFSESNISDRKHPVFGKLSKEQWGLATWKHIDHHLKQFGA